MEAEVRRLKRLIWISAGQMACAIVFGLTAWLSGIEAPSFQFSMGMLTAFSISAACETVLPCPARVRGAP